NGLAAVHLLATSDGAGGARGLDSFQLFADFGSGYVPISALVGGLFAIQTVNGGVLDITIPASAPTGTTSFRAEFVRNSNGPRIVELDAILEPVVPEPSTIALMALGGLAIFGWIKRRRGA